MRLTTDAGIEVESRILSDTSKDAIKRKIDAILGEKKEYWPLKLIIPVHCALGFEYRGFFVREWHHSGSVRFDCAIGYKD